MHHSNFDVIKSWTNCAEIKVLYVNKHAIRCSFRAGAKAIRYSVNALFQFGPVSVHSRPKYLECKL